MQLGGYGHLALSWSTLSANVHSHVVIQPSHDTVVVPRPLRVLTNSWTCSKPFWLSPTIHNVLRVHRAWVKSGSLVGGERAAKTLIPTRDLHWLIFHVVVWLSDAFLSLKILMGCTTLVVVTWLRCLEIFESITWLRPYRTVFLVSLPRVSCHEIILMLLVHRRLPLVDHEEVLGSFVGRDGGRWIVDIKVGRGSLMGYLLGTHWRSHIYGLYRCQILWLLRPTTHIQVHMFHRSSHVDRLVYTPLVGNSVAGSRNGFVG